MKNEVRRLITEEKVRPDGRGVDQIRPLSSEVGLLPERTVQDCLQGAKHRHSVFVH